MEEIIHWKLRKLTEMRRGVGGNNRPRTVYSHASPTLLCIYHITVMRIYTLHSVHGNKMLYYIIMASSRMFATFYKGFHE